MITLPMDQPRFDKPFDPQDVEKKWYNFWEEKGFFHAGEIRSTSRPFCIVIPPPNITGSLHMGHALNNTLQDVLVRWKRMQGKDALWMPGTDHAGIATQNVVERQLMASGTNRQTIGRENFIDRVWKWREESGRSIISQLKRLGASCDWSRERFTMDEGLSAAVREVFVRLYEEGLIYRGERLINWCPRCETALSDIEVDHEETKGKIYDIRYPIADGADLYLVVSTTRPETMLGDTAVAVHPDDPRYNHLIGKFILLPLTTRKIPIVGDSILVDREFGTGAVKITPAHDFNDEKAGQRHGLDVISLFDQSGKMDPLALSLEAAVQNRLLKQLAQKSVVESRKLVVEELEKQDFLIQVKDHRHALGKCYRCKTVVEPYRSPQWFVKVNDPDKSLATPAIEAVRTGKIRIIPEGWRNNYFGWMENIQDWCISRQIWWGHRIPAWYCLLCNTDKTLKIPGSGAGVTPAMALQPIDSPPPVIVIGAKPIVQLKAPKVCPECGSDDIIQDPDVLDTWFSSALWPFSTLGWPEETPELKFFYPTSTLVTSFDILFFWVARMIMMGLKFRGEVPFREVYIHALVRDAEGQKMSKSKGNVVDPLGVMEQYGTDALRFTLTSMASPGRDIKLSTERIEGNRNFANKIWNAARFIHLQLEGSEKPFDSKPGSQNESQKMADLWIIFRLSEVIRTVNGALDQYRFDEASQALYQFVWHEFCDWYLELIKPVLSDTNNPSRQVTLTTLVDTFETLLRLLHPFMPFITEEIWQTLPHKDASIMVAPYPTTSLSPLENEAKVGMMDDIISIISEIRKIRSELNIPPSQQLKAGLRTLTRDYANTIRSCGEADIRRLARLGDFVVGDNPVMSSDAIISHISTGELFVELEGVDLRREESRLKKALISKQAEFDKVDTRWKSPEFNKKAPADVVASTDLRRNELSKEVYDLSQQLQRIKDLLTKNEAS